MNTENAADTTAPEAPVQPQEASQTAPEAAAPPEGTGLSLEALAGLAQAFTYEEHVYGYGPVARIIHRRVITGIFPLEFHPFIGRQQMELTAKDPLGRVRKTNAMLDFPLIGANNLDEAIAYYGPCCQTAQNDGNRQFADVLSEQFKQHMAQSARIQGPGVPRR